MRVSMGVGVCERVVYVFIMALALNLFRERNVHSLLRRAAPIAQQCNKTDLNY